MHYLGGDVPDTDAKDTLEGLIKDESWWDHFASVSGEFRIFPRVSFHSPENSSSFRSG